MDRTPPTLTKLLYVLSPVELPSADAGVEIGTRHLLWEHHRCEAGRADTPHCPLSGLPDQRGKASEKERKYYVLLITSPLHHRHQIKLPHHAEWCVAVPAGSQLSGKWNGSLCCPWQARALSLLLVVTELEATPFLPRILTRRLSSYYGFRPMV